MATKSKPSVGKPKTKPSTRVVKMQPKKGSSINRSKILFAGITVAVVAVVFSVFTGIPFSALNINANTTTNFGTTTVGSTPENLNSNYKIASAYVPSNGGKVSTMKLYLDGKASTSGNGTVRTAIYSDAAGKPGNLLGYSAVKTIPAGQAAGWVTFEFGNPVWVTATTKYWLAATAGDKTVARVYRGTTADAKVWGTNAGGTIPTATFGAANNAAGPLSIYAEAVTSTTSTPVVTSINDTTVGTGLNQFAYTGTWYTSTPAAAYGADNHFTNVSGASYSVKFSGTQVKVYGEKNTSAGVMAISVDGGAETMVDTYASTRSDNTLVFTSATLANGEHTIRVRVTGTKNTASSGTYIVADRLEVTSVGVTPTPTPTPTPSTPSGEAMPVGDLTGWKQVFTDDFTNGNVPVGSFPGSYGTKWSVGYGDNVPDTAGKNNGGRSVYMPSKVLSINNGVMNMYLHSENGKSYGAAPMPKVNKQTWPYNGQLYGKWTVRFKSDAIHGFKTAWLLWPDSGLWNDGEIDFPEGDLDGTISAFHHCVGANPANNCLAVGTQAKFTDWHTASIEWSPGRVTFILDGKQIGTTTNSVPTKPMHYVMQTESCFGGSSDCPAAGASANLQVDWIAVYTRQ